VTKPRARGWSTPASASSTLGTSPGRGTSGIGSACSSPSCSSWNEEIIERIGPPSWIACVRRALNERPSRNRSTAKVIGWSGSPARRK